MPKVMHCIVVMGPAQVGRTTLVNQFVHFNPQSEIVKTIHNLTFDLSEVNLTLEIIDISSADSLEDEHIRLFELKAADSFLLVCDINNRDSLAEVTRLQREIIQERGQNIAIMIVANKMDLMVEEGNSSRVSFSSNKIIIDFFRNFQDFRQIFPFSRKKFKNITQNRTYSISKKFIVLLKFSKKNFS